MPETTKSSPRPEGLDSCRPEQKGTDPVALAWLPDEWMQGDEAEQQATFDFLRRALDEGRPAGYKLSP